MGLLSFFVALFLVCLAMILLDGIFDEMRIQQRKRDHEDALEAQKRWEKVYQIDESDGGN
jgi:hypothetical protein